MGYPAAISSEEDELGLALMESPLEQSGPVGEASRRLPSHGQITFCPGKEREAAETSITASLP